MGELPHIFHNQTLIFRAVMDPPALAGSVVWSVLDGGGAPVVGLANVLAGNAADTSVFIAEIVASAHQVLVNPPAQRVILVSWRSTGGIARTKLIGYQVAPTGLPPAGSTNVSPPLVLRDGDYPEGDVYFTVVPTGTDALTGDRPDNTANGGNARGQFAVDLQLTRTAATEIASGDTSVISGGEMNTASGIRSTVVGGSGNIASGAGATVLGGVLNVADAANSVASGNRATTRGTSGKVAFANGFFATTGDAQNSGVLLRSQTTNATLTQLSTNGAAIVAGNANALPNNGIYAYSIMVVARNTANNDCASWSIQGLIKRGANAAATALVGAPTIALIARDAGASTWVVAVAANTTLGSLNVNVTGAAATTIRWVASMSTVEVA
jgi:hypothetical protein